MLLRNKRAILVIVALTILSEVGCAKRSSMPPADRVFLNGVVYTADAEQSVASAVAVSGKRISFVGSDADAQAFIGEQTEVTDLVGRMILPGLHDMHIHPMGIIQGDGCDLESEPLDLAALANAVATCVAAQELPPGEWLPVDQWSFSNGNQPSGGFATLREALDAAAPDNPVILWGNDGHHGAVNSQALARAVNADGVIVGISAETIAGDFAGYRETIGVDAAGKPNGELHETARDLVQPPPWGIIGGLPAEAMPQIAAVLAANGITSVQDAATPPASLPLYKSLVDSDALTFHFSAALFQEVKDFTDRSGKINVASMLEELNKAREQYRDVPGIQANTVKVFVDGVLEGNPLNNPPTLPNAAMVEPYKQPQFDIDLAAGRAEITGYVDTDSELCQRVRDDLDSFLVPDSAAAFYEEHGFYPVQCRISRGVLEHPADYIHAYMRAADAAGFKIHAHVIGDRAVRTAVDSFEALQAANGKSGLRHSLGHIQVVAPEDYQRIGDLGLYLVFTYAWINPEIAYDLTVNPFIDQLDGIGDLYRADSYYMTNAYPAAQLQAKGAIVAAGSDAPVDTRDPRPFVNIQQAVTRSNAGGQVFNPAGRLDILSALDAYTINGARLFGHEQETGSIEVGKLADLVMIDQDVLALVAQGKSDQIMDTRVLLTLFEGRPVFSAL